MTNRRPDPDRDPPSRDGHTHLGGEPAAAPPDPLPPCSNYTEFLEQGAETQSPERWKELVDQMLRTTHAEDRARIRRLRERTS